MTADYRSAKQAIAKMRRIFPYEGNAPVIDVPREAPYPGGIRGLGTRGEGEEPMPSRMKRPVRGTLLLAGLVVSLVVGQMWFGTAQRARAEDNVNVIEGDSGLKTVSVAVSLSTALSKTATVAYHTEDGSALGGEDYVPTSGTVVFLPGETRHLVPVQIIGDIKPEGDENFFLVTEGSRATITIVDDDPSVTIGSNAILEGDAGVHDLVFAVTLFVPAATPPGPTTSTTTPAPGGRFGKAVTVRYFTTDGTALAGKDYLATSGLLTFAPGETSKAISVPVIGNLIPERDKNFFVNLVDPNNAQISLAIATGTIINDDAIASTGEPPPGFTLPGGPPPPGALPGLSGVRSVTSRGNLINFGNAPSFGSAAGLPLKGAIVGGAMTPSGNGYWLVASDGGIFAYGDAQFFGSTGSIRLNRPIVGMAATPTGEGYWLVASDGGIFAFGDAGFLGSTGDLDTVRPVVGMAATPSGQGYWIVTSGGGIFSFGDAGFFGSMGGRPLSRPVVAMAGSPSGNGYWLVGSDGGVFAFGDAQFFGSTIGMRLNEPVVGLEPTPTGKGYWLMAADGGLFAFGDAPALPRQQDLTPGVPVVGVLVTPNRPAPTPTG
jgi:hypothetical protein